MSLYSKFLNHVRKSPKKPNMKILLNETIKEIRFFYIRCRTLRIFCDNTFFWPLLEEPLFIHVDLQDRTILGRNCPGENRCALLGIFQVGVVCRGSCEGWNISVQQKVHMVECLRMANVLGWYLSWFHIPVCPHFH